MRLIVSIICVVILSGCSEVIKGDIKFDLEPVQNVEEQTHQKTVSP